MTFTSTEKARGLTVACASAVIFAALFVPAGAQRPWSPRRPEASRASTPYLDAAVGVANWLNTLERPMNPGLAWADHDGPNAFVATGVSAGAAGIGFFFLRLYQATKNPTYLDKARRAADYVAAAHATGRAGAAAEWFTGRAGEGDFFLTLHAATGDPLQLERARAAGEWLLRDAKEGGGGYYWVHPQANGRVYTGFAHGTAGVVHFLTRLYEVSGDERFLAYARGGVRWMKGYVYEWEDGSVGWKRLTTDANAYHGWCGGATGIYYVLKRLHRVTGEPEYRELMLRTARGLVVGMHPRCPDGSLSCAAPEAATRAWYSYSPGAGHTMSAYCHGASTNAVVLFDAYHETGDETFLRAARAGARWLRAVGEPAPGGLKWEHIYGEPLEETGLGGGAAGDGYAFVKYSRYDPDPAYAEAAKAAAGYLLAIATRPQPGQMRWPNFTSKTDWIPDQPANLSGWYVGAAGVGIFMLELHSATLGVAAGYDLSGINP
ncbi:MAG TPA: lanthionine synthetase LanC family protein [Pyrinomonadaceae bacterium]